MPHGLGVGIPHQLAVNDAGYYQRALGTLRPSWWMNWLYDRIDYIYPAYTPMVWAMKMNGAANRAVTASWYGPRLWLLGNEPERADQSNTPPKEAADMSGWWAHAASGQFAAPGVMLGLKDAYVWLDAYLAAGGVVPHAWHVHNYAWTETTWDNQYWEFMQWTARNKVERPVIVSETACLAVYLSDQIKVMNRVQAALEQGRIIAACWYSTSDPFGWISAADLLTVSKALTALGEHYTGQAIEPPPVLEPSIWLPGVAG